MARSPFPYRPLTRRPEPTVQQVISNYIRHDPFDLASRIPPVVSPHQPSWIKYPEKPDRGNEDEVPRDVNGSIYDIERRLIYDIERRLFQLEQRVSAIELSMP